MSNLDAKLRAEVRLEIRSLQQRLGLTSLMVTHDREEALTMADRLVVMENGRVRQIGTPRNSMTRRRMPSSPTSSAAAISSTGRRESDTPFPHR